MKTCKECCWYVEKNFEEEDPVFPKILYFCNGFKSDEVRFIEDINTIPTWCPDVMDTKNADL